MPEETPEVVIPEVALSPYAFVTKQEARDYVFTRERDASDEDAADERILFRIVNAACAAIEKHCKKYFIIREGIEEYHDGGDDEIFLHYYPVTEISEVAENGSAIASTLYDHYPDMGLLYRKSGVFYHGRRKVKVTYSAGYGTQAVDEETGEVTAIEGVPEDVRMAALSWIRTIQKTEPENFSAQVQGGVVFRPEQIPAEVAGMLNPYVKPVVR